MPVPSHEHRRWLPCATAALAIAITALVAAPAGAATFPQEIRGTIGGSNAGDGLNTSWTGPIVFRRVTRDAQGRVHAEPTYQPTTGTAIAWQSKLTRPTCTGGSSGVLGPAQLTGVLVITARRAAAGFPWSMSIKPKKTGQTKAMPVSGTCVNAATGQPEAVTEDAALDYLALGYNSYDIGGKHRQNYHTKDLKNFTGLGKATGELGNQVWTWTLKGKASKLTAVPSASAATRGQRASLNGSRSTPAREITKYTWKFLPATGACASPPSRSARKAGRRVKITVLCTLKAELTVHDADGVTDTASTMVTVRPRRGKEWATPFTHREKTGDPRTPKGKPQVIAGNFLTGDAGLNVADCGNESPGSLIVCPLLDGRKTWLDRGYGLKKVDDPHGPFDDDFYVVKPTLSVKRAALISPNYLPGSTFYEYNKTKADANVVGFLNAIRQHEGLGGAKADTGHSQIMKRLVEEPPSNPRRVIESDFGSSRAKAAEAADKHLHAVDAHIDKASDDPLDDIWVGAIWAFDDYKDVWTHVPGVRVPGNKPAR